MSDSDYNRSSNGKHGPRRFAKTQPATQTYKLKSKKPPGMTGYEYARYVAFNIKNKLEQASLLDEPEPTE